MVNVTKNSLSQHYTHPDNHTSSIYDVTPGFNLVKDLTGPLRIFEDCQRPAKDLKIFLYAKTFVKILKDSIKIL